MLYKNFFEGAEKKVEICGLGIDFRSLPYEFWETFVSNCDAQILSTISNEFLDSYLLSESSLFVWNNRILAITCGNTMLSQSVEWLVREIGHSGIASIIYQRKNEYQPQLQSNGFFNDIDCLEKIFPGKSYRFGHLDGHYQYLYHSGNKLVLDPHDVTSEFLMYGIDSKIADLFCSNLWEVSQIRKFLGLNDILKNFTIDDHLFQPCGYSLNAICGRNYVTIHVTPEHDTSYVSLETNSNDPVFVNSLFQHFLLRFQANSVDVMQFGNSQMPILSSNFVCVDRVELRIAGNYPLSFFYFISSSNHINSPVLLKSFSSPVKLKINSQQNKIPA